MGMFDEVLANVGEPYKGGGKGFEYGTHEVIIGMIEPQQKKTKNNPEAEVIVVTVYDPADEDRTAEATLYFHTEGGAKMSLTKILGIMVHNVGEEKKDKVRELGKKLFANIDDPTKARDVAAQLMMDKFTGTADKPAGYNAFLFADPQGKYKTTNYGDIWHYDYEDPDADDKADAAAASDIHEDIKNGEPVSTEDIPNFDDL